MADILLQIKNIKKDYPALGAPALGVKQALKGISFDIQKGEILGLLGVNGAGKTTLSSIIATLHPATSGDILWNSGLSQNKSIFQDLLNYRKIVGFCPQKPNLDMMLTLEENLIFAGRYYGMQKDEIDKKIEELAFKFNLTEYLKSSAYVLSGGFKQRFLIARTLIHSPKLVILDEPTVGLDPQIRHQLWSVIKELKNQGITVLLTTHYLDEAEYLSDRVCIIDSGLIITVDTPDNLKFIHQKSTLEDVFLKLANTNMETV